MINNRFSPSSVLASLYARFPQADERPVVGITGNYGERGCELAKGYYDSVARAGGVPVVLPPVSDPEAIVRALDTVDAVIFSGGGDINPLFLGEEPQPKLGGVNAERDLGELLTARLAYDRQLPMLGICRGIQVMAAALGGTLLQDISHLPGLIKHSQDLDRSQESHTVRIESDSILARIYNNMERIPVNSFHHQAVADPGERFRVTARSADGVVEAMESTEHKPLMGVQWHPECLDSGAPLFSWIVEEASLFAQAKRLHSRVLTLDTHCDTPMFFPQDIHFDQRDSRIKVDLQKMTEGRQDAVIMVAYLPQPTDNPTAYADAIFDRIEHIVASNARHVAIARTPADLVANKRLGRKSIMLGIENGLALGGDATRVKHFAQRGVVYITLCHNGDNDLCDSARNSNDTWGGVSPLGKTVIEEMNAHGIMVDLSHAAEKSFYDALDISRTPIVCSHSSCRALCDHPRNLTDEQMRALAARGGVCQVTLYNGFLVSQGQATIDDALRHLSHAIDVMGIDHVGLGTDFDGDGGIVGLNDSSEMLNFTRQLLRRRYAEADIEKIWGGNFLRVMEEVQKSRTATVTL